MHILFLTHYFPPEVNAPATRTFEHCRRWVECGHEVTVITGAPNCPTGVVFPGYRNAWRTEEEVAGIRVIRAWTYLSPNKGFLRRIVNYVSYWATASWHAFWRKNVDVIVTTSPQLFCGFAGVGLRFLKRKPFVLEVRDIWPESILAVGAMKPSLAIRLLEIVERAMYRAADAIVTVGDGYRKKLEERHVPPEKITVIPNGVDVRQLPLVRPDSRLRADWHGEGKFVCAYIGTIGMAHGLEVVLKAAKLLKDRQRSDVQFWIVGDGAERESLEQQARAQELDHVSFPGMVSKEKVAEVLRNCDACLVHLRGTELFGTVIPSKVFETMALNVPIIMGVTGQAQQIVLEAGAGVPMTPDDPESLLTALDEIQRQPARYQRGRDYVAREFDRQELADRMLTLLETVVESPPAGECDPVLLPVPRRSFSPCDRKAA